MKITTLEKKDLETISNRKINTVKNNTSKDLHHTIAKSRDWELDAHNTKGHIVLSRDLHRKFHNLFYNLLPHEQILAWTAINRNVLSEKVKNILTSIKLDDFYDEAFKRVKEYKGSKWFSMKNIQKIMFNSWKK